MISCVAMLALTGCQGSSSVKAQAAALTLGSDSMAKRQSQLRRFETDNEKNVLSAASAVVQDLGFTIEETEARVGLVMGSKDRDAVEQGQVAGEVFLAALVTAMGGRADPEWDSVQKIRISVSTSRSAEKNGTIARVSFQRIVWTTKNRVSKLETIDDPEIYRQFFEKLEQALFLEAHDL